MTLKVTKAFASLFYGHILTEQKAERQVCMSNKCRCGGNRGKSSPRGSAHLPRCLEPGKCLVLSLDAVKRSSLQLYHLHPRIHLPLSVMSLIGQHGSHVIITTI